MTALRRTPSKLRRVRKRPTPDGLTLNRPSSLAWFVSGVLALQGVLMFAFGIETRRKSLEVLAPANSEDHSHPVPSTS